MVPCTATPSEAAVALFSGSASPRKHKCIRALRNSKEKIQEQTQWKLKEQKWSLVNPL